MSLSRRALLRGNLGTAHISSLVVHCRPDVIERVLADINALEGTEVPEFAPEGKLVVLMESPTEREIMQRISTIEAIPGVVGAALVYHHVDSETDE